MQPLDMCLWGAGWGTRGASDKDCSRGLTERQSQVFANTRHHHTSLDSPHVARVPAGATALMPHVTANEPIGRPGEPGLCLR